MATQTGHAGATQSGPLSILARHLGLVVLLFAVVGVGLGLTGYVGIGWLQHRFAAGAEGGFARNMAGLFASVVFLQSALVATLVGPVVAAVAGVGVGRSLRQSTAAVLCGGFGAFLGFFVLTTVAVFLMATALPASGGGTGGGSPAGAGQVLGQLWLAAVPTAFVGAVAGVVGTRL
jgi:hypothetical protein